MLPRSWILDPNFIVPDIPEAIAVSFVKLPPRFNLTF
ncbi:hypothetical protein TIFTF001_052300 [Ficus carica]|uniref:Uncharacterized protein n=1 Tax=Ficus carica TaxID=3494 RepID=A0AA88JH26_FICCA|nr:hypothetical protein TIFTF001_052300 [Ficus carica]